MKPARIAVICIAAGALMAYPASPLLAAFIAG